MPTDKTWWLRHMSLNRSNVVTQGVLLQHTRSTGLSICQHLPHLHQSRVPCSGGYLGDGGDSRMLLFSSFRCDKDFSSSTPPQSSSNFTSRSSCSSLVKERTSTYKTRLRWSWTKFMAFTRSLFACNSACTCELPVPLVPTSVVLTTAWFLHGPAFDLQRQQALQYFPCFLQG